MKIAIVARAPSSRYLAPFTDDSWEIWNLSPMEAPAYTDLPRWDRWYELHQLDEKEAEAPGYQKWMAIHADKVWLREPHPNVPGANIFDREAIFGLIQENLVNHFQYYTSQVSLMLAAAIYEGPAEIGVWGADMCQFTEYGTQRASCEFFLGFAAGAGIKVTIPMECDLCKAQRVYGLDSETHWERKLRVHQLELESKINRYHAELNEAKQACVGSAAAHGEIKALLGKLNGQASAEFLNAAGSTLQRLEAVNSESKQKVDELDSNIKMTSGAMEEIQYQKQFNP